MAPTPEENTIRISPDVKQTGAAVPTDDTIVISGMSALMPGCQDVVEFKEKLYNKENLVTKETTHWCYKHPELSEYQGCVPDLDRFDAQFFMTHYRLAKVMEPMSKKLLEQAYQAIFDAGICPSELSGKKVGVYIGATYSETEKVYSYQTISFGMIGCNRTMYANRISYCLNLKGPSMVIDASCTSSLVALEKAYHAIMTGVCDAAIVGGAKLLLHPQSYIHYSRLLSVNRDGKTKCYDMDADGQSKSEAINIIFLQKHKDAKRVYASLSYVKSCFMPGKEKENQKFGPYREPEEISRFLRSFYDKVGIPPSVVEYVEGFGAALSQADKAELQALDEVYCKNRVRESSPLLVGSVMSNMGYTEAASGTSAIIKLLLAYHTGKLAANLHCMNPRQDVAGVRDGRIRIVTDHHQFKRSYTAVNGFSVNGNNVHALLQGHYKPKILSKYKSDIPYLVTVSGRQESAVQRVLDELKSYQVDPEQIALLHNIYRLRISGHLSRGFGVFSSNQNLEPVVLSEKVDYYDSVRRPLWLVYSGMGSQWPGMATELMRIPIFADAIGRCHQVLKPKGVDLIHILTSPEKGIYNNILHSFVGIAAVQIGLTDVLRAIGLVPDKIIGHSVGELGCAYADGCFTAEEMILSAYSRGLVSLQTPFIKGSMAAVGLGFKQISKMVPPEIDVACHNGPDSCTISGPEQIMKSFVAELTSQGIFAKEVPCSNIAYHSRYIQEAGPGLRKYLSEVIQDPKRRSDRWVSTSVSEDNWNHPEAMYSSAEYHTNNLLNPVLFEETSKLVPPGAVLVEVAPHGLLQAILKRSVPNNCTNIALTRRGHTDNALFLLEAIGKLYMEGYDFDLSALYPKIEFPVSTETPQLSHLVEWMHTEKWGLCLYLEPDKIPAAIYKPIVTVHDEEYQFLAGHIIKGANVLPFASVFVFVWDTLAMSIGKNRQEVSVQFRDIRCHSQPPLDGDVPLKLHVSVQKGSGQFEVTCEHGMIAEGFICAATKKEYNSSVEDEEQSLSTVDIYKLLFERGYDYKRDFRSIYSSNTSLTMAKIIFDENWVTIIDGMIQLNILRQNYDGVSQVNYIRKLNIDYKKHWMESSDQEGRTLVDAYYDESLNRTTCGGITLEGVYFKEMPVVSKQSVELKTLKYVPFYQPDSDDMAINLYVIMQIIAENLNSNKLTVYELNNPKNSSLLECVRHLLQSPPEIKVNVVSTGEHDLSDSGFISRISKTDVMLVHDLHSKRKFLESFQHALPPQMFVLNFGSQSTSPCPSTLLRTVCCMGQGAESLELAIWKPSLVKYATSAVSVRSQYDLEVLKTTRNTLPTTQKIIVLSPYPCTPGLKDLIQEWRKEKQRNLVYLAMVNHYIEDDQDAENMPRLDLAINILDHGKWGGEYFVPLKEKKQAEENIVLQSAQRGDLGSLQWVKAPATNRRGIPVTVHYAGLNVRDVYRATAEAPMASACSGYGMDFSGVTASGDRVMGLIEGSAASKHVLANRQLLWPVPAHWSLEDAATVPLPYAHAFYCFGVRYKITRGQRVLVHGGAGALGQAAISIALANGCEVFATVSDVRKKHFLRKLFPELKDDHIGNSRNVSFSDMVLSITRGEGVDVVISCVKGELKNVTLSCVNMAGVTFDTVQVPTQDNYTYGMFSMTKARSYVALDISTIFQHRDEMKQVQLMISEGIAKGYVRPLSRVCYEPLEATRAFQLLAHSRHRGRVLLRVGQHLTAVKSRLTCTPDRCYLLICDETGFALQLADRLVNNGARNLHLHLPRPTAYHDYKILHWKQQGVQVSITSSDLRDNKNVVSMLKAANKIGPVEDIYTVAVNIPDDGSKDMISFVVNNLDLAARELCPQLKHFAVISADDIIGQEVCLQRLKQRLPSLLVRLHHLQSFDYSGMALEEYLPNCLTTKNGLDVVEVGVLSNEPIVVASASPATMATSLELLKNIPGVNSSLATSSQLTLGQLGIDLTKATEICRLMKDKFGIDVTEDNLADLSVGMITNRNHNNEEEMEPLRGYYSYVDTDEMLASAEMLRMETLRHYVVDARLDDFDSNEPYLCIVPGIEGHCSRFQSLCERLKLSAVVLQSGLDVRNESVKDMAQRLVNNMLKKINIKKHFYLLGYEFGELIALEMAAILESYGFTGTVYCLGGTPEELQRTLMLQLKDMTTDELQNHLIQHIFKLMTGSKSEDLLHDLNETEDWDEKTEIAIRALTNKASASKQYTKGILDTAYSKIQLICRYIYELPALRSKIVFMRANLPNKIKDENIQKYSQQTVTVHKLAADLADAPKDLRCASIINKYLEAEILNDFNTKSHCEVYVLDNESFLQIV